MYFVPVQTNLTFVVYEVIHHYIQSRQFSIKFGRDYSASGRISVCAQVQAQATSAATGMTFDVCIPAS